MKSNNSNFRRLTVHLFNNEHKKNFETTVTYKDVISEAEAIRTIWAMHSNPTDNSHDMSRKIIRATYNGKVLAAFKNEAEHTKNGWVLK
jgi:hypothetical protein